MNRLNNKGKKNDLTGCFEWQGYKNPKGYGFISYNKKPKAVHRLKWELENGPIPEEKMILHNCDNPCCFEISHLRIGTARENTEDMMSKGRHKKAFSKQKTILKRSSSNISVEQARNIMDLLKLGHTADYISKKTLASKYTVYDIKCGYSWKHLRLPDDIWDYKKQKLTSLTVKGIKLMLNNRTSNRMIAKKFSVSEQTICNIKNNRRWAHVKIED